jgi:hypothetical protein
VVASLARDINRLLSPLIGSNKDAAAKVQEVLSASASKGQSLEQDVQRGVKTGAEAADELMVIVRVTFDDLRHVVLSSGAAEASSNAVGVVAGEQMVKFYDTNLAWTSKLLPLFFVPAVAVLPALMHGMPGEPMGLGHLAWQCWCSLTEAVVVPGTRHQCFENR